MSMIGSHRVAPRRLGREGPRGQSLVEFALVLPTFLVVVFVLVQIILLLRAEGAVGTLATDVARRVAHSGAETARLDADLPAWAGAAGLTPNQTVVRVTTTAADHSVQAGDEHALTSAPAHPAPPGVFDADVTVTLRYTYLMDVPLLGQRSFVLTAQARQTNTYYGSGGE